MSQLLFEKAMTSEAQARLLDVAKLSEREKSWMNVAEQMAEIAAQENIALTALLDFFHSDAVRRAVEHNFYDTAEAAFTRFYTLYHTKQWTVPVQTVSGFPAASGGSDQMFFDRDTVLLEVRRFLQRFQGGNFLDDFCDGLFFEYRLFPHELRTLLTSMDVLSCFSQRVCSDVLPVHLERRYGDLVRCDPQSYVYPRLGSLSSMAFFPEQFVAALDVLLLDLVRFGLSWASVRLLFAKGLMVPERAVSELRTFLCGKKVPVALRKLSRSASLLELIEVLWMGHVAHDRKRLTTALPLASLGS